jgi:hypothetical protein
MRKGKKFVVRAGRVIGQVDKQHDNVIHLPSSLSRPEVDSASQQSMPIAPSETSSDQELKVADQPLLHQLIKQVHKLDRRVQELDGDVEELKTEEKEQSSLLELILEKVKQNPYAVVQNCLLGALMLNFVFEVEKELVQPLIKTAAEWVRIYGPACINMIGEKAPWDSLRTFAKLIWSKLGR